MSRRRCHSSRRALTLVELVIVILIIGILTAGVAPKFADSLKQTRADAACLRLKADLTLARQTAISSSSVQVVKFTANSTAYTLPGLTDPDHPDRTGYTVDLADGLYRAKVTSASFGSGSTVTFDRYGQPQNGGTVTLSAGNITKTVSVDASSGTVSIP